MTLSAAPVRVAKSASITVAGAAGQPPRTTQSRGDTSVRCFSVSSMGPGILTLLQETPLLDVEDATIARRASKGCPCWRVGLVATPDASLLGLRLRHRGVLLRVGSPLRLGSRRRGLDGVYVSANWARREHGPLAALPHQVPRDRADGPPYE